MITDIYDVPNLSRNTTAPAQGTYNSNSFTKLANGINQHTHTHTHTHTHITHAQMST